MKLGRNDLLSLRQSFLKFNGVGIRLQYVHNDDLSLSEVKFWVWRLVASGLSPVVAIAIRLKILHDPAEL